MRAFLPKGIKNKQAPFIAGLAIALFGLFAGGGLTLSRVSADEVSNNIIPNGFSTPSEFISKVRASSELQNIYADPDYGLTSSMYTDFANNAKSGTTCTDGNLYDGSGNVVGTNSSSIGRDSYLQGSGYFTKTINGHKYYGNVNSKAFASKCLSVSILYSGTGQAVFAAIKSCGNPVHFTPKVPKPTPPPPAPKPAYNCVQTTAALASSTNNYSYVFRTTTTATNGAKLAKVVYAVDGHSVTSDAAGTASYTFTTTGSHALKATAYFTVPGTSEQSDTSTGCAITVKVVQPLYECSGLTSTFVNGDKTDYDFVATAKYAAGVVPLSATFTLGDGTTLAGVKPTSVTSTGSKFTVEHKYAEANKYAVAAQLYFTVPGQAGTSAAVNKCTGQATPSGFTQYCKPGVPVGSPECTPCQYDTTLPANSPQCVPPVPPTLPNTGAGNTIAIFSAVVIGGFLIYRQLLFRKHKAAFAAAQLGTSPLPLGDPLNDEAPLAGTPLAPKRSSFRRKRPF